MRTLWLFISLSVGLSIFSQTGKIRGKVIDLSNNEPLIGATILVKETLKGTITDLDGNFTLEAPEGTYTLQVSFISYQTQIIEKVIVSSEKVNVLESIFLKDGLNLETVTISVETTRQTENSLMLAKKRSVVIMDGISSEKMQLTGDGNAADAAKRVTGVTIEGNKYIYVRGLGDRYTKTTLNGLDIPGLDPDVNSLQMDIFPSQLIDNLMVRKNFTADMPADFAGGIMNIETKAFPNDKFFTISLGTSYNPQMNLNSNYLTYGGSKTDFLGFDNGSRAIPTLANGSNIPSPFSGSSQDEVNQFVGSFNPELGAIKKMSPLDYDLGISFGNQIKLKSKNNAEDEGYKISPKLGYIVSVNYKSQYKFFDDVKFGEYQKYIDENKSELRYATVQEGQVGEHNVLLGSMIGLAYKTQNSKIRLNIMHLQNGESRAGQFKIDNDGEAVGQSGYIAYSDNLEYNQRSVSNVLLHGKHSLDSSKWDLDWRVSPTYSNSTDPDIRKTAFTYTATDTFFSAGAGGNPSRIWRYLSEVNLASRFDIARNYEFKSNPAKFKFGASYNFKKRDYEIKFFDMQFFGNQSWDNYDPNSVLEPENIYPNSPNIYYQSGNKAPNSNQYESSINNLGFYIHNEFKPISNLNVILGLRAEKFDQRHTGRDQTYSSGDTINGKNLVNEKVLETFNLFPSTVLIYNVNEDQNLRFAYATTIVRPSFKELSFAQILDPISNRIFNGSLFTYDDWDGNLKETNIHNLDLRWENYGKNGQLISFSGFYKYFINPIELVRIPEQQTSTEYQPRNVGNGFLYGAEIELKKHLGFINDKMEKFIFSCNFTYVKSQIEMTDTEYQARLSYKKVDETVTRTRQMAGQSPYVINSGIEYRDTDKNMNIGLFYNVKGASLLIVGSGLFPDVYQQPFHSLNFGFSKSLGKENKASIDINISNLLNDKIDILYESFEAEPQIFSSFNPGISFGLGFKYKF